MPKDDTGTENESDWDEEDDFPLQQLERTQPAKKQKKDKLTINYKERKKLYDVPNSTFTGNVLEAPRNPLTPLDYFYQFIDNDMFQILAENTNLYAVQKHGKSLDTNLKELEQIVGMVFRMELVRMPSSRMYWENDTRHAPVADIMSRNRFLNIIAKLHFVDNLSVTEKQQQDKLWKIRPWLNKFRENCLKLVPEEYNSIDEQMVPFKGKFSRIKQYMQNKPHKWCRCGISGLLHDFDVYQGKGREIHENSIGLSGDVVLQLCATLPAGKNYKAIADNFFTSMALLCKLKERGILYLGTVRKN